MRRFASLVFVALLPAGPLPAPAGTVSDMSGHAVALTAPAQRIVSLVPSATELIFALGADDRLVGRTDYCDFPPAARAKPSVGGMLDPSLERIVALRPDLVIASESGNTEQTYAELRRLGIPVYLVHANRVAEMFDAIGRLAELTGRPASAALLRRRLEARIADVVTAVKNRPRPRVLYVLWPDPLVVPGRDAIVTELIALAGGDSVTAGEAGGYPQFSLETAVTRRPDVIVLARHGGGSAPIASGPWERFGSLPAVRDRRIHAVDGDLLHRYGPRIVDGLRALAHAIHPEAVP
jgi:iron complex transport system substrate-binding protein